RHRRGVPREASVRGPAAWAPGLEVSHVSVLCRRRKDDPERLIAFLENSAVGLAAMKHYMAVTHSQRQPSAPILDVGCGAGHDLNLLATLGLAAVGVDPSSTMLQAASGRGCSRFVRAAGE